MKIKIRCIMLMAMVAASVRGQSLSVEVQETSRQELASNPYRPLYHFSSPKGKLHDPGGFGKWNGKYHLFYIHQVDGKRLKGHAVSDDMVQWFDLPSNAGEYGFTGQLVVNGGQALMSFGRGDGVHLARSTDPMLVDWEQSLILPGDTLLEKYQNPIDTCFWREDGEWFMLARLQNWEEGLWHFKGDPPALGLFRSADLKEWEAAGTFYKKTNSLEPGDDLACPNFLPLGDDRYLLLYYCHPRGPMYSVGLYDKQARQFSPEQQGRASFGPTKLGSLHAPSAFVDAEGRCTAIFNITENREHEEGWIGLMSLPRRLSLSPDYLKPLKRERRLESDNLKRRFHPLQIKPIDELSRLRFNPQKVDSIIIPANGERVLTGIQGKAMELDVEIDPKKAREVGLHILRSPDGAEQTTIRLFMQGDGRAGEVRELSIEVSDASLDAEVRARPPEIGPLFLKWGEPLRLRVFVDRSVVEVFANDRQCLTVRTYPTREDSTGVSVFTKGSDAELLSLKAWQMRSIWPELKYLEGK